jgi:hypothetical protein
MKMSIFAPDGNRKIKWRRKLINYFGSVTKKETRCLAQRLSAFSFDFHFLTYIFYRHAIDVSIWKISNSVEQFPSWEDDTRPAGQEISV